jgi:hypothetical protein
VEQLKSDLLGVTRDLAGIEAVIGEIVRLSLAGDIDVAHVTPAEAFPRGPVPGTPAVEAPYVEPGLIGREGSPAEQPGSGKAKRAPVSGPSELARSVARGASLSKALWGSTIEATVIPAAVAGEIIPDVVARAAVAESLLNADELVARGAGMPGAAGIEPAPAMPVSQAAPAMAQPSPVVQTIETYNTIVNVVKDSAIARDILGRDILPTRGATRAEITRYLLAMPGQPADDRQLKALAGLAAALQANVRPALPVAADMPAGTSMSGDIPDLWTAVRALQDAYDSLRENIPAPASLTGLQKAVVDGMPAAAITAGETATPRLSIAIEGVKTPGSSVVLPDFTLVTDQFRPMQDMMAHLQVPMYGEGGTVAEPTLAFIAESGPEHIMSSEDYASFKGQIASLNDNYESLWENVLVLRDGIREMTASVNDALGNISTGGSETESDSYFGDLWDRFATHFHISNDDIKRLATSWTLGGVSTAVGNLGTEYYFNVLEEWLVPDEVGGAGAAAGAGEAGQDDAEDREEEEFWDLMDKIDQINTIRNKRQGKFE